MKNCPFCAEEIQDAARKCRYCNEWLTSPQAVKGNIKFGDALKSIRNRRRMTLLEMSELTGVQSATLSRMENNKTIGSLNNYINIAKALGLSLSELFVELEKTEKDGI